MEIVWIIGFMFSVGYCDLLEVDGTWRALGIILIYAFLWPLLLGAEFGGHVHSGDDTSNSSVHRMAHGPPEPYGAVSGLL